MDLSVVIIGLAGVLVTAAPVIFAVIGETFAERSGVINLSVNGSIVLSAMVGFAVAVTTDSLVLGYQHHPAPIPGGSWFRLDLYNAQPGIFLGQSFHQPARSDVTPPAHTNTI
jgi:hypothetical protein